MLILLLIAIVLFLLYFATRAFVGTGDNSWLYKTWKFETSTGPVAFEPQTAEASVALSVIVPAYNEELRIPTMLDETLQFLKKRREACELPFLPHFPG